MSWFLKNLVSAFLLPPSSLIVLGAVGVLFLKSRPVLGKFLVIATLILFYILSIPIVAENALQTLKTPVKSNSEINKAAGNRNIRWRNLFQGSGIWRSYSKSVWIRAYSLWSILTSVHRKTDISDGG